MDDNFCDIYIQNIPIDITRVCHFKKKHKIYFYLNANLIYSKRKVFRIYLLKQVQLKK